MMEYTQMTKEQLLDEKKQLISEYEAVKAKGLHLDMSRGKPDAKQLDLSEDMLRVLDDPRACLSPAGADYRNYGFVDGTPEAKALFSALMEP